MSVGRSWRAEPSIERGWCEGCMLETHQVRVKERWEEQGDRGEWREGKKERGWCLACSRMVREV
jgi:hypothetical protein